MYIHICMYICTIWLEVNLKFVKEKGNIGLVNWTLRCKYNYYNHPLVWMAILYGRYHPSINEIHICPKSLPLFQKITIRTDSALIWLRNIIKWFSIRGRRKQIMPQCFQVECLENVLEEIFSFLYLRTNLAIKTIEFYRILFT